MFKPNEKSDRLNYCKMLTCPEEYSLDFALGTTYSLDLETLAAVCFAFGADSEFSESMMNNPVILLNAFQKVSDRILVFSEPGQIHLPNKITKLDFLLEKMVVPVLLEKVGNRYPSFHPKIWVLRYINFEGEYLYRLLVLSRNLTFDRSWDFCFTIDGKIDKKQSNGKEVSDFIDFLVQAIPETLTHSEHKKSILAELSKEIRQVYFETNNKDFNNFIFMPLGIGKKSYPIYEERLLNRYKSFDELIVFSPFVSNEMMEEFNQNGRNSERHKRTLFTRDFSLKKIGNRNLTNFDVYTIKDTIYDGEEIISEDSEEEAGKQHQDIHAKLYQLDYKKEHYFYFGSANATYNGFNKNVEVLCRLDSEGYQCAKFKRDLLGDKNNSAFKKVDISNLEVESEDNNKIISDRLEQGIKDICHMQSVGVVNKVSEEKFDLTLNIEIPSDFDKANYEIRLFNCKKKVALEERMEFKDLELMELSEFYIISAKALNENGEEICVERVIIIHTAPIPEEREKIVVKSIINNRESFFEYISYVLTDDFILTSFENTNKKLLGLEHIEKAEMPAIYEKLLKTCLMDKSRIKDLQFVMDNIEDANIIPDDFRKLYEVFIGAMGGQL